MHNEISISETVCVSSPTPLTSSRRLGAVVAASVTSITFVSNIAVCHDFQELVQCDYKRTLN
jgi:hypothetical protein